MAKNKLPQYQWPTRADGSSKTVGEMTRPERDAMLAHARPRLQRFADELSAGIAAQDAIAKARSVSP